MKLHPTPLAGAWLVELEPIADERGYFARSYDAALWADHGMDPRVAQSNISFNDRAGTLRGMHFQREPHGEAKLIRCVRGAVHDVIVDLRPGSDTYLRTFGVELSGHRSLYAPSGCAHGFQTLEDETEVLYLMSAPYEPAAADGVRWDDPLFAIAWPPAPAGGRIISARDQGYPDFRP